jgi:hypothetical protein
LLRFFLYSTDMMRLSYCWILKMQVDVSLDIGWSVLIPAAALYPWQF